MSIQEVDLRIHFGRNTVEHAAGTTGRLAMLGVYSGSVNYGRPLKRTSHVATSDFAYPIEERVQLKHTLICR